MKELFLRVGFVSLLLFVSVLGRNVTSRRRIASQRRRLYELNNKRQAQILSWDDYEAMQHPDSKEKKETDSIEDTHEFYNEQCIDHDADCTQKSNQFTQRYWASMKNFRPGGPLFVLIGGETDYSYYAEGGAWTDYAKKYGAATIATEHRFYGQSYPGGNRDQTPENFKFLTVKQTLADYAQLITWFKSRHSNLKDAKVVVFGGSYPGYLSVLMRQEYPNLVNVAVASSAPVDWDLENPGFVKSISANIKQSNPSCFNKIKSMYTCMEGIVYGTGCAETKSTLATVSQNSNVCWDSLNWPIEKDNYMTTATKMFADVDAVSASLNPGGYCDILMPMTEKDPIKLFGKFVRKIGKTVSCTRRRKRQVTDYTSYLWELCNELGNFQVSDPELGMLGTKWGKDTYVNNCPLTFTTAGFDEAKVSAGIAKRREKYPLDKIKQGSCTIFINGSWDPWSATSITNIADTNPKNAVYVIPKGGHTGDQTLGWPTKQANSATEAVQQRVKDRIGVYLNSPDC